MNRILLILTVILLASCAKQDMFYQRAERGWEDTPLPTSELVYSFYLVGDAGGDTAYSTPVMDRLQDQLDAAPADRSGVILLGDNIYPEGMHKKKSKKRPLDEERLNVQLDAVKYFEGDIFVIPGNHDWDRQGSGGWKHVKRQEKYVQEYLDKGNVFLPSHGCPGPEDIKLAPGVVLIIIDTQWWLHEFERPSGEKDGCDVRNASELMVQFKDLLKKYRNQHVIVAGHHPLYSNGHHGGHFEVKDHLFPLTAVADKAYIPLPVIGSIYPLYRKFFGHPQDIAHPVYWEMRDQLLSAMNEYENVTYVAGHEHNLQYVSKNNIHHIVSGAGSKVTHLKYDNQIQFGAEERGYSKINVYDNGEVWVEFYTTNVETRQETLAFRKMLFQRDLVGVKAIAEVEKVSYEGQFATVVPDSSFDASGLKRVFFGDLNRDLWCTPVKVPYLDIHYVHGGLTPIKKGGGMQTLSLRMQGGDGKQYVLRGIKKNSTFLTAKNLRGTLAQDIIYDGMAGSHPYASVVIPKLSSAAGVYHSNPTLVYLPDDPILGDYQEEFGGMFCLFEERPNDDMSDADSFGNSEEVINYHEAIEEMHDHYTHVVDKEYMVKARLFDVLIGDWDRHDDQWRWGVFKEGKYTYYRAIPRDRDQAFFQFDGLFLNLANRKWTIRKFQPFREEIRDMIGQNFNARYFDRSFLVEASREDFIAAAKYLQENVTDEVIAAAFADLPPEGFEVNGEEIIEVLKARRANLVEFAEEYYEILAKEVSIAGTLKDDYFDVKRHDDGSVEVNVYPRKKGKKKEKKQYYHRIFYPDETKEIRLYGIEGNDEYKIKGKVDESILIRIIAGDQSDHIEDKSKVRGLKKMTRIYEVEGNNEIEFGKEAKMVVADEIDPMDYDRKDYKTNVLAPSASLGFNPNDGFYIGPGFRLVKQGFKKSPFAQEHKLTAHYAFGSEGYNIDYQFQYVDVFGKADLAGKLELTQPLVFQYFGAGNETQVENQEIENNQVRMNDFQGQASLRFTSKSRSQYLQFSLGYQYADVLDGPLDEVNPWEYQGQDFVGGGFEYVYENTEVINFSKRGVYFMAGAFANSSMTNDNVSYVKVSSEARFYIPISFLRNKASLNFRVGGEHNFGDYAFFQAAFLNGFQNFRGVQRNRFSGRTSSYNNLDLRVNLFNVKNYIVPFKVGVVGHSDVARVWEDNENSDRWHASYGGGIFLNFIDVFTLVGTYSISDVDEILLIGTRFYF
ncbi:metallophosphoesterase [Sanyastnella coralliicola]|uniref:metallophosphoesterase n=1 Tax=Sanyastnella coralliicola TaxID=3069118 RepID=UPI0027BAA279|nr:metallophosphoesterase [Longitalea sp. SCSIO 12813]